MSQTRGRLPRIFLLALVLVVVDQAIKLVIWNYFYLADVTLVPGVFWFRPMQNTRLSWFGSLGIPLFDQLWFNVLFSAVLLYLIVMAYLFSVYKMQANSRYLDTAFLFIFSGAVCSFVDTVFWGGSIDYIQLFNWFTFDLKDCFISAFEVMLILAIFIFYKRFEQVSFRALARWCLKWK